MSPTPKRPPWDRDAAAAAAARFATIAEPDVAYAIVDTPVGKVVAANTRRGLACLSYADHHGGIEPVIERLSASLSPRILEAPARLDEVRRELDEYFEGRRHDFDVPIDWSYLAGFTREVLRATAKIRGPPTRPNKLSNSPYTPTQKPGPSRNVESRPTAG